MPMALLQSKYYLSNWYDVYSFNPKLYWVKNHHNEHKFGITTNIGQRISAYQTHSPGELDFNYFYMQRRDHIETYIQRLMKNSGSDIMNPEWTDESEHEAYNILKMAVKIDRDFRKQDNNIFWRYGRQENDGIFKNDYSFRQKGDDRHFLFEFRHKNLWFLVSNSKRFDPQYKYYNSTEPDLYLNKTDFNDKEFHKEKLQIEIYDTDDNEQNQMILLESLSNYTTPNESFYIDKFKVENINYNFGISKKNFNRRGIITFLNYKSWAIDSAFGFIENLLLIYDVNLKKNNSEVEHQILANEDLL